MLGVLLIKFFINKSCFWYFRWFVVIQFIMHVSAFVVVRQWRNYAGPLLSNYITICWTVLFLNATSFMFKVTISVVNLINIIICFSVILTRVFFSTKSLFFKMIILTTKRIEMHTVDCSSKGTWRLELFSV